MNGLGVVKNSGGTKWQTGNTKKAAVNKEDQVDYSSNPVINDSKQNWEAMIRESVRSLSANYSGVQVVFGDLNNESQIRKYAESAGSGTYLVLSSSFMDWVKSGPKGFESGMALVQKAMKELSYQVQGMTMQGTRVIGAGVVIGDAGEITTWTSVTEEDKDKQKEIDHWKEMLSNLESQKKFFEKMLQKTKEKKKKIVLKSKPNYSAGMELSKLSRVNTVSNVKMLVSSTQAKLFALKGNSGYDKKEVKALESQMNGVILRAKAKIKQLKEEEVMEQRVKKLTEEQKLEKARLIHQELEKRRSNRKTREHAQISDYDQYWLSSMGRRSDGILDPDEDPFTVQNNVVVSPVEAASIPAAAAGPLPMGDVLPAGGGLPVGGAGAAAPAVDVAVASVDISV